MRLPLLLVVVACSQTPPPITKPEPPPVPTSTIATCADMGPLLRGAVDDEEQAGKAKEKLIEQTCIDDKWPRAAIDCVAKASEPEVNDCLTKLSPEQNEVYEAAVARWREKYSEVGEGGGEFDHDSPPPPEVDCSDAISDADTWAPPVTDATAKPIASSLRESALSMRCVGDPWSNALKQCLADSPTTSTDCLDAYLGSSERQDVATAIADADAKVAKIVGQLKKKPATYGCKQVVATHYGDATWKGKLPSLKGAGRTRAIKESRKLLTDACTNDGWSDAARACIVAGLGDDCFGQLVTTAAATWGYPASGVTVKTGVAACDNYGVAIAKYGQCSSIPQASRDAMTAAYAEMTQAITSTPTAEKNSLEAGCKVALDALNQASAALGCPL